MIPEGVTGVLIGYGSITAVIAVGYLIRRIGFLETSAEAVLSRVTVFVATPALYFAVLARTDASLVVSPYALATLLSLLVAAGVATMLLVLSRRRPERREAILLVTAGISPNSGNIGIPIGVAVLGSTSYLSPIILLQVVLITPMMLLLLAFTDRGRSVRRTMVSLVVNPLVFAAIAGVAVAAWSIPLPAAVLAPVDLLGDASIPLMLLAFGMSLRGARPWTQLARRTWVVLAPTLVKMLVLPALAYAIGVALGVSGVELLALVVVGALPVAQNLYALAHSYRGGPDVIRSVVIVSTLLSLPVLIAATLLLSHT